MIKDFKPLTSLTSEKKGVKVVLRLKEIEHLKRLVMLSLETVKQGVLMPHRDFVVFKESSKSNKIKVSSAVSIGDAVNKQLCLDFKETTTLRLSINRFEELTSKMTKYRSS